MPRTLKSELHNDIVEILKLHLEQDARETVVKPILQGNVARYLIDWSGNALNFTNRLVEQLSHDEVIALLRRVAENDESLILPAETLCERLTDILWGSVNGIKINEQPWHALKMQLVEITGYIEEMPIQYIEMYECCVRFPEHCDAYWDDLLSKLFDLPAQTRELNSDKVDSSSNIYPWSPIDEFIERIASHEHHKCRSKLRALVNSRIKDINIRQKLRNHINKFGPMARAEHHVITIEIDKEKQGPYSLAINEYITSALNNEWTFVKTLVALSKLSSIIDIQKNVQDILARYTHGSEPTIHVFAPLRLAGIIDIESWPISLEWLPEGSVIGDHFKHCVIRSIERLKLRTRSSQILEFWRRRWEYARRVTISGSGHVWFTPNELNNITAFKAKWYFLSQNFTDKFTLVFECDLCGLSENDDRREKISDMLLGTGMPCALWSRDAHTFFENQLLIATRLETILPMDIYAFTESFWKEEHTFDIARRLAVMYDPADMIPPYSDSESTQFTAHALSEKINDK